MPGQDTPSEHERQIRELIDDWRSALAARDLDRMMRHYARDVVFFDAVPPYQHHGAEAYRGTWERMFSILPPRIESELKEIKITISGDLAVMHGLNRLVNSETKEAATCGWVRVTVTYERQHSIWKVVHEHVSVPFDPHTGAAAFIRKL
jgi:uncharacterized protein (TIGR02246 family)